MKERMLKKLEYIGYDKPGTPLEIDFEIAGLKIVILQAEEKIALFEQAKILAKIELEKQKNNYDAK